MIFKLDKGADIVEAISAVCKSKKIRSGSVFFIGAVKSATLSCYDQRGKKYKKMAVNKPMEIISGIGNISIKDNVPFLHAHVSLSDDKGKMTGGHLCSPTIVFACEAVIIKSGAKLVRRYDAETGLFLWQK